MTFPADPGSPSSDNPGGYPPAGYGYGPPAGQYGGTPPGQYGGPPPAPQYGAPPPVRWRGRRSIQVGIVLAAVGLVLLVTGGVLAATKSLSKVNGFQRVAVSDGSGTVTFSHAGGYIAYYESSSVSSSTHQRIPVITGTLTNQAAGATVILRTPYGNRSDGKIKFLHYDYNGHKGLAMWQFHIDEPGTYQVQLSRSSVAAPDAVVAFGPSIAGGVVVGGILIIGGVLLLIAGVITLIVGLVLRSRHRTQVRASAGYTGYAWPQGGGTWPQGGAPNWPAQGGWPPQDPNKPAP